MTVEKKFLPEFKIYIPSNPLGRGYVYWKDKEGNYKKKYGHINTFLSIEDKLKSARFLIEELSSNYIPISPIILEGRQWLENRKGLYAKKTYQGLYSKLNCLEDWLKGRSLTNETMKEFFFWLSVHRHKTTYNTYLSKFQLIFSGLDRGDLLQNISSVRAYSSPAKYFQLYQVKRLKNKIENENPELWLFCQFVYYCFLRPGRELRFLRIGDIQFDDWKIRVNGAFAKNGKQQYVTIPIAFRPSLEPLIITLSVDFAFRDLVIDGG